MKIRKIKIKNFRNLRDIEFFPKSTTIIVGENNAGKSNLLHALRLMLDPESGRLVLDLSEEDINEHAFSEGERYFSVLIEIGDLQKHQNLEAIFRERISKEGDETYVTIEGRFEHNDSGEYEWSVKVLSPEGRENDPINFNIRMRKSIPLFFLDPVRDARRDMKATGSGALSQLLKDIELSDVKEEIIENIKKANTALGKNQDINDLATGITDHLSEHLWGGEGKASMTVATEDPSQLIKGLRLNLQCHPDCRTYDMFKHGTGLQNLVLISMFRHRISCAQGINPILVIEEPEAHLHPQAQQCLLNDLLKIDSPVILTTHSPTLVRNSNPFEILRMTLSNEDKVSVHQLDESAIDGNTLKSLSMMMRAGRSDAFFARSIIIVEGQSELIALSAFAEHMEHNLGRDGISLISMEGNAFSNILLSCNDDNFCIPTVVAFDTDVLSNDNNLLKQACKSGLIERATQDAERTGTAESRKRVLENIGWIPVESSFEEEVTKSGYFVVIMNVISENGAEGSLNHFLKREGLDSNPQSIAKFLKSHSGERLKIPVAQSVAENVEQGSIPDCYRRAIEEAVSKSV